MPERTCAVDGCGRTQRLRRGLCPGHYARWLKHGDNFSRTPLDIERRGSVTERFWRRVDKTPNCWNWTGPDNGVGYGVIGAGGANAPMLYVHRISYELHVGPIPDGLHIDHLCRNRRCVNPAHLEAVTSATNVLRGEGFAGRNVRKTHCIHGHEFTEGNTHITPQGRRNCRACGRERARKRRQ